MGLECNNKQTLCISFRDKNLVLDRCLAHGSRATMELKQFKTSTLKSLSKLSYGDCACSEDCFNDGIKNIIVNIPHLKSLEDEATLEVLDHIKSFRLSSISISSEDDQFTYFDGIINFLSSLNEKNTKQVNFSTDGNTLSLHKIKKLAKLQDKTRIKYSITLEVNKYSKKKYKTIIKAKLLKKYFDLKVNYSYIEEDDTNVIAVLAFFNKIGILTRNITIDVDHTSSKDERESLLNNFKSAQKLFIH